MSLSPTYLPDETGYLISAVNVSGTKYNIRDNDARVAISASLSVIDQLSTMAIGGVHYIGKAADSDNITDGSDLSVVHIGTTSVEVVQGDMVSHKNPAGSGPDCEYIWNGFNWNELGSTGTLKALAFKNNASASYTPGGNVGISADGASTVDFTQATFSGNTSTLTGSLTINEITGLNGTINGTETSLTADVTAPTSSWTVDFTKLSVNAITGIATFDAIKSVPTLEKTSGKGITQNVTLKVDSFTAIQSVQSGTSPAFLTAVGGKTTTFSGTCTPNGSVDLSTLGVELNSGTGRPTGTSSFFNSASVDNQVLSFGSGDAVTGLTADVLTTLTFSGMTGAVKFNGSSTNITATGTPLVSSDSSTITVVSSATSNTYSNISASGSFTNNDVLTAFSVAYCGDPAAATLTLGSGTVTGSGTQNIQYAPPTKEISIGYTPSGTVTIDDFTPTGSVTVNVKPTGSITGSQAIAAHTHGAAFSGTSATITVS